MDDPDLRDLSPDQLLAAFLDACRDRNQEAATDAIHELRYRVWSECPLPRDVRPDPKEQARAPKGCSMTRQQRMIEAFADYEAAIRDRINRENVEVLVEMGWKHEDATAFVHENPTEGENHARRNNDQTQIQAIGRRAG